jgi:alpha-tubulin suppressor-like RCC1 family protein
MRHAACLTNTRGVLLRSDGRPVGFGRDHVRQKLPAVGRRFKDLAAGYGHVVFICENGAAVAFGDNDYGQIEIPSGRFIACAAGWHHTLWVRSDGAAVASGRNDNGQCRVPDLPTGLRYTGAAAGWSHSVLLRSDGQAVAFGYDGEGRCTIPTLPLYRRYVSVACGAYHTCLVRDDGIAVAVGKDGHGQASVPDMGQHGYWRAGAGNLHTILLTADGEAVCFGDGSSGLRNDDHEYAIKHALNCAGSRASRSDRIRQHYMFVALQRLRNNDDRKHIHDGKLNYDWQYYPRT